MSDELSTFRDHCRRMGGRVTQANIHLDPKQRALFRLLAAEIDDWQAKGLADDAESHTEPLWGNE